jgi:hypothetical protein
MSKIPKDVAKTALLKARKCGISLDALVEVLDDEVHSIKGEEAATINNDGIESQIGFIGWDSFLLLMDAHKKK